MNDDERPHPDAEGNDSERLDPATIGKQLDEAFGSYYLEPTGERLTPEEIAALGPDDVEDVSEHIIEIGGEYFVQRYGPVAEVRLFRDGEPLTDTPIIIGADPSTPEEEFERLAVELYDDFQAVTGQFSDEYVAGFVATLEDAYFRPITDEVIAFLRDVAKVRVNDDAETSDGEADLDLEPHEYAPVESRTNELLHEELARITREVFLEGESGASFKTGQAREILGHAWAWAVADAREAVTSSGRSLDDITDDEFQAEVDALFQAGTYVTRAWLTSAEHTIHGMAKVILESLGDSTELPRKIAQAVRDELRGTPREGQPLSQLAAPQPVDGHFRLPMNHLVSAVDEATRNALSRAGWTDFGGTTAPHYVKTTGRGRNVVRISSRPGDGELYVPDEVRAQLWAGLERLGDEAADTFYAVLIALTARGEDSIGEPAWLRPDELLDIRGVKRRRARGEPSNWQHGHRAAALLDTHRALTALAGLWVTLDVVAAPARGKRPAKTLSWEGKVIALTDTMGQRTLAGEIIPHRVRIVLGGWAEHYQQAALRQVGLIAQKAFQYDTSRYKAEKRLTGYLALQFKFNASGRAKPLSCKVETLLEHADITRDAARPGETRKRLETALGRLERDGVSAGWAYAGGAPDLAARGWLDDWLALSIRIIPPPPVDAEYAGLRPEPEAPKLAS